MFFKSLSHKQNRRAIKKANQLKAKTKVHSLEKFKSIKPWYDSRRKLSKELGLV